MSKHTPGHWKVTSDSPAGTGSFARVMTAYDSKPGFYGPHGICDVISPNTTEDAHLIAAAPELLEALRDCIALYDGRDDEDVPGYIMDAREAIAKAEGKS